LTAIVFCLQTACEFGFSAGQQSLLSSVVFGGMVLGAAAWGLAADALGRQTTLLASCSVVVAAGLASAAAPGYAVRCALLASPSNLFKLYVVWVRMRWAGVQRCWRHAAWLWQQVWQALLLLAMRCVVRSWQFRPMFKITCCLPADRQANNAAAAGVMQRCSCGRFAKRCCPWLCGGLEEENLAAPLLRL
jgi:MFS family permease